jgi:DNA-damage-inducible protein J
MKMGNISIRVPDDVKQQATAVFSDLGLDMSTAINIFLRQSIRQNGLPFRPTNDPFWSESNQRYLQKTIAEMESGKDTITKTLTELEGLAKDEA